MNRYNSIVQGIAAPIEHGHIEHIGPETVASIERLDEEVLRVLRSEYVGGVKEVYDEVLIRCRKEG